MRAEKKIAKMSITAAATRVRSKNNYFEKKRFHDPGKSGPERTPARTRHLSRYATAAAADTLSVEHERP